MRTCVVCGAAVMPDQLVRHVGWHRRPSVSVRSVVTEEWFVPQGRAVPVLSPAVSNLPVREADGLPRPAVAELLPPGPGITRQRRWDGSVVWEMQTGVYITSTPGVCGGKPCMVGTRVTTEHVAGLVGGMGPSELAEEFGVDVELVLAAVDFEAFRTACEETP